MKKRVSPVEYFMKWYRAHKARKLTFGQSVHMLVDNFVEEVKWRHCGADTVAANVAARLKK